MSSTNIFGQRASYAILFEKTPTSTLAEGYLFVDMLRKGGCSSGVMLVRSVESGKLYIRKYIAPQDEKEFNLWESEVCFTRDLTNSGFSVRFHSACSNDDGEYRTLVTEFCDGGSCQEWFGRHANPENREFMAWLLIVEATRALAYLHSDNATDQGGLWHGDVHLGNIFLHFGDQLIPRILFGDFGLSLYRHEADKAKLQGQDLPCDLGYIGEMKIALYNNPVQPPVAESMRRILSLFPTMPGIDSAQQLLDRIEADAGARMAYLQSLPDFNIPKPEVSDAPLLFYAPKTTRTHSRELKRLPQNEPGEPGWQWVKMDLSDEAYRSFETIPCEPPGKITQAVAFFEKLDDSEKEDSAS
jgi:serine/threonine protein kinase